MGRCGSGRCSCPSAGGCPGGDNSPLLWATSEPVPGAGRVWQALTDVHPDTGLVPILLAFLDEYRRQGRPWDSGELGEGCDLAAVDGLDAATVLARQWDCLVPTAEELESDHEAAEMVGPYGVQFPGLARGQEQALTEAELARALGWFGVTALVILNIQRLNYLCTIRHNSARIAGNLNT